MLAVDPGNPRGIVWLASFPRSGNTWMRLFINRLFEVTSRSPAPPVDMNRRSGIEANDSDETLYADLLGKPVGLASRQEIAAARPRVQELILRRSGGLVLIKTHNANIDYLGAPLVRRDLSAGGIYLVRNPLDVAISFAAFCNTSIDESIRRMAMPGLGTANVAGQVYTQSGSWSENVESWTTPVHPAILVLRYEDMVLKPEETFGAMAQHLFMPATPGQLRRAIADTSFERLDAAERTGGFHELPEGTKRFFREGRTDQWRTILTRAQIATIVGNHRPAMSRFGYLTPEILAAV